MVEDKKTAFKEECDSFFAEVEKNRRKPKQDLVGLLANKYGVGKTIIQRRIKSYYGVSTQEKVKLILTPTKAELTEAISLSGSWEEVKQKLNLTNSLSKGLLDKYYGVSNFAKTKALLRLETPTIKYSPTLDDNRSVAISQHFGDGSYCKKRNAFRLSHGEKQGGYLYWKVGLFNKAFPTTFPVSNIKNKIHTQGHAYYFWYSGKLPSSYSNLFAKDKHELVEYMTPFGWLLYFLDDGYFDLDLTNRGNNYFTLYIHDTKLLCAIRKELESYGVSTTVSNNYLKVGTYEGIVNLYKNFIEPFLDQIPNCMLYKTRLKI